MIDLKTMKRNVSDILHGIRKQSCERPDVLMRLLSQYTASKLVLTSIL